MDDLDREALSVVLERAVLRPVVEAARSDPDLRTALARVARWVLAELESTVTPALTVHPPEAELLPAGAVGDVTSGGVSDDSAPVAIESATGREGTTAAVPVPVPKRPILLRLGSERPIQLEVPDVPDHTYAGHGPLVVEPPGPSWGGGISAIDVLDLDLVKRRCELKAQACRFAAERRSDEGMDRDAAAARYRELIVRAKSMPDCYLWPLDPGWSEALPSDEAMRAAAGCYEALAAAVELNHDLVTSADGPELIGEAFAVLAEAQSALRQALADLLEDRDQFVVFGWLRRQVEWRQVYVARHMRRDDPAAPEGWAQTRARVEEVRRHWAGRRSRGRERQQLMSKARYHARRVIGADHAVSEDDLASLGAAVDALARAGVDAASAEIRDLVSPVWEALADRPFDGAMGAVMEEMARRRSAGDAPEPPPPPPPRRRSASVAQVAEMLRGRAMVLVGGERRAYSSRAIEEALGLSELHWLDAPEHESLSRFEPYVGRPEVALVGVIIKLSSHSFGELRDVCRRYGKGFIYLTHGYNPEQIARAVLEQCSRQLTGGGVG